MILLKGKSYYVVILLLKTCCDFPFPRRVKGKIFMMDCKTLHDLIPYYLSDLISQYSLTCSLHSRHISLLADLQAQQALPNPAVPSYCTTLHGICMTLTLSKNLLACTFSMRPTLVVLFKIVTLTILTPYLPLSLHHFYGGCQPNI